jgi:hypothetical protein
MTVLRVTTTLGLAASLLSVCLSNAQTSDGRPPANEFVRQIIDNELQAEKSDHSHWMLRLETRKSGTTEVREVVETKDGNLDWLISVNGKPLPEDQRRDRGRGLGRLINNPAELKKSRRETDEDQARSQRLLKILPDALFFEYGEQRGDLVELKFKPNSHSRPSSHEAAVVHAMEGMLWVNGRQKRLMEISGHLTRPVKFGGGLLGHLDAGGHFYVKQEEVQPGYWELTVLDVDMKGKALFFKTIGVQEEMKGSVFRRVRDDLTAAQGANLLYQQVPATGKISSERHSTEVFDQQAPPLPNIAKPVAGLVLDEFDRPDGNPFSHHWPSALSLSAFTRSEVSRHTRGSPCARGLHRLWNTCIGEVFGIVIDAAEAAQGASDCKAV